MADSLALKYRPKDFDEVVKQDASIEILQNQIEQDKLKQAYLFAGASGCGKTTTARILASKIDADVIELNCADNNSVDDVRHLIEQAQLKPLTGKFKVYILDECHMFSKSAFNAMLKLLEEPPKHCIFILCTTDPQNILPTVLGRLQRFNFTRIPQPDIIARLKAILEWEDIPYQDDAVEYIAKLANGGMRDAISKLDTIIDYGKDITLESVVECCGTINYDDILDFSFAVLDKATGDCVQLLDKLYYSGKDLNLFLRDYYTTLVEIAKVKLTGDVNKSSIPSTYSEDIAQLEYSEVTDLLNLVAKLMNEAKYEKCNILFIEGLLIREMSK